MLKKVLLVNSLKKKKFFVRSFKETPFTILGKEKKKFLQYSSKELKEMKKSLVLNYQNHDEKRAKMLIKLGKFEEAKELLLNLPKNSENLALLGSQFLVLNKVEKAMEIFLNSIEMDSEKGIMSCIQSIFSVENTKIHQFALELCDLLLEKNPHDNNIKIMKNDVSNALLNENTEESIEPLTRFRPLDWLILFKYAAILYMKKNVEESIKLLKKSVSLTDNYIPRYYLGVFSMEIEDYEQSVRMFQSVIDINDKSDSVSLYHLADAYGRVLRFEDTLTVLNKSLELSPRNYFSNRLRGITLLRLNQPKEAFYDIEIALGCNPDDLETIYYYALSLLEMGEIEESLKKFDEYISIEPNVAKVWFEKGMCFYQLFVKNLHDTTVNEDYFNNSLNCFLKSIEIDERFSRSYFAVGMLYEGLGEYQTALEYVEKGLTYDDKEPSGLSLRQKILEKI